MIAKRDITLKYCITGTKLMQSHFMVFKILSTFITFVITAAAFVTTFMMPVTTKTILVNMGFENCIYRSASCDYRKNTCHYNNDFCRYGQGNCSYRSYACFHSRSLCKSSFHWISQKSSWVHVSWKFRLPSFLFL